MFELFSKISSRTGNPTRLPDVEATWGDSWTFTTVLILVILLLNEINTLSKFLLSSSILFTTAIELSGVTVTAMEPMKSKTAFQDI